MDEAEQGQGFVGKGRAGAGPQSGCQWEFAEFLPSTLTTPLCSRALQHSPFAEAEME